MNNPWMNNGGTWETREGPAFINWNHFLSLALEQFGLLNYSRSYTNLRGHVWSHYKTTFHDNKNKQWQQRALFFRSFHKRNSFRTQCTVVWLNSSCPQASHACIKSSNSRLQYVSKKVCTHSLSMFPWAFFYSDGRVERRGNKYIGPVNGNNNKIWLIKLK